MNISDKKHSHSHQILRTNTHSSQKKLTEKQKQEFIIIDHDPQIIENYQKDGLICICGDIADPYIQELVLIDGFRV